MVYRFADGFGDRGEGLDFYRPVTRAEQIIAKRPACSSLFLGSGFRGKTGEFQNVRLSRHRLNILQRLGKLCLTKWL
jgi:hypothetical protein